MRVMGGCMKLLPCLNVTLGMNACAAEPGWAPITLLFEEKEETLYF